MYSYYPARTV